MAAFPEDFSQLLREYRKRAGWTQEEMASQWSYSTDTISSWERGKRSPSVRDIPRLARLLGIEPDELVAYIKGSSKHYTLRETLTSATQENTLTIWKEVQRMYRIRTDFTHDFSYPRMLEHAQSVLAVGISLNALALNYNQERLIEAILNKQCAYRLCFLDPDSTYCSEREHEEGLRPGIITDLTHLNINHIRSIQEYVCSINPTCIENLQVRVYDSPPRLNIYIVDNSLMTIQFYVYSRGEDTPVFVFKRQVDSGLFDFYASAAQHLFESARVLGTRAGNNKDETGPGG